MAAMSVTAFFAVAFAAAAGCLAGRSLFSGARRLRLASATSGFDGGAAAWLVRNGVRPLIGPSRWLLGISQVEELVSEIVEVLRSRDLAATAESAASLLLGGLTLLFLVVWACSSSLACAFAFACCAVIGLASFARTRRERRAASLREGIPDVIRSMGVCFGAGMTLLQTVEQVASEAEEPLGGLFREAAYTLEAGGSTAEALNCLKGERDAEELAFIAVALDVQHRSGGGVLPILESAREAAQDAIDLQRSLRVQTAQAKLSARIVTAMPFVLIALFSFVSEGFLDPFFESAAGLALLLIALFMQAAGVVLVRQMLKVDVR